MLVLVTVDSRPATTDVTETKSWTVLVNWTVTAPLFSRSGAIEAVAERSETKNDKFIFVV